MTCLGVLDRGECDKDTKTGLKEGGGIEMSTTEMSTTVLPYTRCTLSLAFEYLPAYNSTLHLLYNLTLDPMVEYFKRYLSLSTANLLTQLGGKSNTCSCSSPTPYSASTSPPSLPSPPPVVVVIKIVFVVCCNVIERK